MSETRCVIVDPNAEEIREAARALSLMLLNLSDEPRAVAVLIRATTTMLRAVLASGPAGANDTEIRRLLDEMRTLVWGDTSAQRAPVVH